MIKIQNVTHQFSAIDRPVIRDISLIIEDGQFLSISGRSGSGKTTLLYILSSLERPSQGQVLYDDKDIWQAPESFRLEIRNRQIGFIFQFHYLIQELTVLENVLLPARKVNEHNYRKSRAKALLEKVGLGEKLNRYPRQLSGGEQQRVAIARSLIMEPRYLFADEPTGSLDTATADLVINILQEANRSSGTTFILVTHEPDFAKLAPHQIFLKDGQIVSQKVWEQNF